MQISEHEMNRRKLHAAAQSAITDAMKAFTQRYGDLTVAEWVDVLLTAARRYNAYTMKDEWRPEKSET